MSKASEYAARQKAPTFRAKAVDPNSEGVQQEEWFASVRGDGHLSLRGVLPASGALALADWIYDTFGEPEEKETK